MSIKNEVEAKWLKVKTVGLVSLSSGILGEESVSHEYEIGMKRLREYGLEVKVMDYALKGVDYIKNHPEQRAEDLINAFRDPSIDMILCAIGGDDTYRLLPYLFENDELKNVVTEKIFLGFSDTTINHFMLHKVGLRTFYGQSFLPDVCELDNEMLPYSRWYFEELIETGRIAEIRPSNIWYDEREDFGIDAVGTKRISHENQGFELLQGNPVFSGEILGGCIESMYDMFDHSRYEDTVLLCEKYRLFPTLEKWRGKILLIESSEEQPDPRRYQKMVMTLKETGIFRVINGVIVGKPMNELYYEEYKNILINTVADEKLPILYNVNIGHATPRCIISFGRKAHVNADEQVIRFEE